MAFITRDQILANVKFALSITHTAEHDIWLLDLIRKGARRLGYTENIITKCADEEIIDGRVGLPCDLQRILLVSPYNYATGETTSSQSPYVYVDTAFAKEFGMSNVGVSGSYKIINDTIHFNSTITATNCKIVYRAYNTDDDGIWMIHQDAEEALENYACWKAGRRFGRSEADINDYKRDWVAQKGMVVGRAAQRSFFQNMPEIQSIMKALVTVKKVYG